MRTQTKKRAKTAKTTDFHRLGVAFKPEAKTRGMELAKRENRSFSNFLNVLIDREWARQKTEAV